MHKTTVTSSKQDTEKRVILMCLTVAVVYLTLQIPYIISAVRKPVLFNRNQLFCVFLLMWIKSWFFLLKWIKSLFYLRWIGGINKDNGHFMPNQTMSKWILCLPSQEQNKLFGLSGSFFKQYCGIPVSTGIKWWSY